MDPKKILSLLGVQGATVEPFINAEDGEEYAVWKVSSGEKTYVLKSAKEYEAEVYSCFLSTDCGYAPKLLARTEQENKTWLLMEYVSGVDLRFCTREKLQKALDALIEMQKQWWQRPGYENAAYSMEAARSGRIRRGEDLGDDRLKQAYQGYLTLWKRLPRTLCHEDLLPFNLLINEEKAVIIDWEVAGMHPYLSSLARLIAHGEEGEDAFFHMTEADRVFAIDYYYRHLLQDKGIAYEDYRMALDYFLLYEYCEWIMLGIRYNDTQSERYIRYRAMAMEHLNKLKPIKEENLWK